MYLERAVLFGGLQRRELPLIEDARLAGRVLAGAWRTDPPQRLVSADELSRAAEILIPRGAGALAWHAIRNQPALHSTPAADLLRDAYRFHVVKSALTSRRTAEVVARLLEAGIDAILIKGWDCARLYPIPGTRPYGDVDILIRPRDHDRAVEAIASLPAGHPVDFEHFETRSAERDGIWERTQVVPLDGVPVRVLSEEDRLRMLVVHFGKHPARRPMWLCDIAATIEGRSASFDWDVATCRDPVQRSWILATARLAASLLGADLTGVPESAPPPRWFEETVLRSLLRQDAVASVAWPTRRREYAVLARDWRARWPDPFMALVKTGRPIPRRRPLELQMLNFSSRLLKRIRALAAA